VKSEKWSMEEKGKDQRSIFFILNPLPFILFSFYFLLPPKGCLSKGILRIGITFYLFLKKEPT